MIDVTGRPNLRDVFPEKQLKVRKIHDIKIIMVLQPCCEQICTARSRFEICESRVKSNIFDTSLLHLYGLSIIRFYELTPEHSNEY